MHFATFPERLVAVREGGESSGRFGARSVLRERHDGSSSVAVGAGLRGDRVAIGICGDGREADLDGCAGFESVRTDFGVGLTEARGTRRGRGPRLLIAGTMRGSRKGAKAQRMDVMRGLFRTDREGIEVLVGVLIVFVGLSGLGVGLSTCAAHGQDAQATGTVIRVEGPGSIRFEGAVEILVDEGPDDRQDAGPTYPLRAGAKRVYVDREGDDSADGLTAASAVRSLFRGYALLEDGAGDQLLLERGDRWDGEYFPLWGVSGFSAAFPVVIGSYGDVGQDARLGGQARPTVAPPGNKSGFEHRTVAVRYVAIVGVEFAGPSDVFAARQSGVSTLGPMEGFTIADCVVRNFGMNVNANAFDGAAVSGLRIVDSIIVDAIATRKKPDGSWGLAHSSGLFLKGIDGVVIEGCTIAGNGWRAEFGRSPLNHGCYVQGDVQGFEFRGNLVIRNSLNGLMARTGGIVEGNVFAGNCSNVFGTDRAEYPELSSGVIRGNLVIGTEFEGLAWGFTVHEVDGLVIEDNVIVNAASTEGNTRGLLLSKRVHNATVRGNHIQAHGHALDVANANALGTAVVGNALLASDGYSPVRGAAEGIAMGLNEMGVAGAYPYALPGDFEARARAGLVSAGEVIAGARGALN